MAGERLIDKAVASLCAYIQANLPTYLASVGAERGITLPEPVEYLDANVPTDNRSPLVEVFDASATCSDDHNNEWVVMCGVAFSFTGDADLASNERSMRAYATAMINTIRASATLGGTVTNASVTEYASDVARGDSATTRNLFQLTVLVTVKDV